jgi:hypothetical protein
MDGQGMQLKGFISILLYTGYGQHDYIEDITCISYSKCIHISLLLYTGYDTSRSLYLGSQSVGT